MQVAILAGGLGVRMGELARNRPKALVDVAGVPIIERVMGAFRAYGHDDFIVALGHQDTDPGGLTPPPGITILGASSDHLVLETPCRVPPGEVIQFIPAYGALVRAMTSLYVAKTWTGSPAGRPDLLD